MSILYISNRNRTLTTGENAQTEIMDSSVVSMPSQKSYGIAILEDIHTIPLNVVVSFKAAVYVLVIRNRHDLCVVNEHIKNKRVSLAPCTRILIEKNVELTALQKSLFSLGQVTYFTEGDKVSLSELTKVKDGYWSKVCALDSMFHEQKYLELTCAGELFKDQLIVDTSLCVDNLTYYCTGPNHYIWTEALKGLSPNMFIVQDFAKTPDCFAGNTRLSSFNIAFFETLSDDWGVEDIIAHFKAAVNRRVFIKTAKLFPVIDGVNGVMLLTEVI